MNQRDYTERQVISCILGSDGGYATALSAGLQRRFFAAFDSLRALEIIEDVYRQTLHVPTTETLAMQGVLWRSAGSGENIEVLVRRLKGHWARGELANIRTRTTQQEQNDPFNAVRGAYDSISEIYDTVSEARKPEDTKGLLQVGYAKYLTAEGTGLLGLPFPYPTLNEVTRGMEPGLSVIYGEPKNYKTVVALYTAFRLFTAGYRVYIVPGEWPRDKYALYLYSFYIPFCLESYRRNSLSTDELRDYKDNMSGFDALPFRIGPIPDLGTPGIGAYMRDAGRFGADIVIVDGAHRLTKTQKWEDVKDYARTLNDHALRQNKPVLPVAQANRQAAQAQGHGKGSFREMGGSVGWSQELNLALRTRKVGYGRAEIDVTESRYSDTTTVSVYTQIGTRMGENGTSVEREQVDF